MLTVDSRQQLLRTAWFRVLNYRDAIVLAPTGRRMKAYGKANARKGGASP